jgi:hypothetical protein
VSARLEPLFFASIRQLALLVLKPIPHNDARPKVQASPCAATTAGMAALAGLGHLLHIL